MPQVLRQKEAVKTQQLNDGTIEEIREPVFVYVHCYNSACVSYHDLQAGLKHERHVPGIREETQYTYSDRGGDMPGHENSHVRWQPQNADDATCPDCGWAMNVSPDASRVLQQYGVGPGMGLKGAERAAALAADKVAIAQEETRAENRTEITELKSELAELKALIKGAAKRPPGRPKKNPDPVAEALDD